MTNCALREPQRWTDRRGEARTSQRPVHGDLEVGSRAAFSAWTGRRTSRALFLGTERARRARWAGGDVSTLLPLNVSALADLTFIIQSVKWARVFALHHGAYLFSESELP